MTLADLEVFGQTINGAWLAGLGACLAGVGSFLSGLMAWRIGKQKMEERHEQEPEARPGNHS